MSDGKKRKGFSVFAKNIRIIHLRKDIFNDLSRNTALLGSKTFNFNSCWYFFFFIRSFYFLLFVIKRLKSFTLYNCASRGYKTMGFLVFFNSFFFFLVFSWRKIRLFLNSVCSLIFCYIWNLKLNNIFFEGSQSVLVVFGK